MKRLTVREFQTRCLQVIADLQKDQIQVVITNRGRAVARLVATKQVPTRVFGCMAGTATDRRPHRIADLVTATR